MVVVVAVAVVVVVVVVTCMTILSLSYSTAVVSIRSVLKKSRSNLLEPRTEHDLDLLEILL